MNVRTVNWKSCLVDAHLPVDLAKAPINYCSNRNFLFHKPFSFNWLMSLLNSSTLSMLFIALESTYVMHSNAWMQHVIFHSSLTNPLPLGCLKVHLVFFSKESTSFWLPQSVYTKFHVSSFFTCLSSSSIKDPSYVCGVPRKTSYFFHCHLNVKLQSQATIP